MQNPKYILNVSTTTDGSTGEPEHMNLTMRGSEETVTEDIDGLLRVVTKQMSFIEDEGENPNSSVIELFAYDLEVRKHMIIVCVEEPSRLYERKQDIELGGKAQEIAEEKIRQESLSVIKNHFNKLCQK